MTSQLTPYVRPQLGCDQFIEAVCINGAIATFAMAALNKCYAGRFNYQGAAGRDITAVKINWATISAAGSVAVRIETIDDTTGKPSGTLYDANAAVTITPVAGWQTCTFATPPTTHLTPGSNYAIVLLTTVGGTTMTLNSGPSFGAYPNRVFTATDGTTRSNLAESVDTPLATVVFDDATQDTLGFFPYAATSVYEMSGTKGAGLKLTLTADIKAAGIAIVSRRAGTVSGDLRFRIFNAAGTLVSGTTATIDKDSLVTGNSRCYVYFTAPVTLTAAAGPYRICIDQSDHAGTASNCWSIRSVTASSSALVPSNTSFCTTVDATASPPVWVEVATDMPAISVMLADLVASTSNVIVIED